MRWMPIGSVRAGQAPARSAGLHCSAALCPRPPCGPNATPLPLRLYSLEEYEGLIDFSRLSPSRPRS